jgi:hypothetical protein
LLYFLKRQQQSVESISELMDIPNAPLRFSWSLAVNVSKT